MREAVVSKRGAAAAQATSGDLRRARRRGFGPGGSPHRGSTSRRSPDPSGVAAFDSPGSSAAPGCQLDGRKPTRGLALELKRGPGHPSGRVFESDAAGVLPPDPRVKEIVTEVARARARRRSGPTSTPGAASSSTTERRQWVLSHVRAASDSLTAPGAGRVSKAEKAAAAARAVDTDYEHRLTATPRPEKPRTCEKPTSEKRGGRRSHGTRSSSPRAAGTSKSSRRSPSSSNRRRSRSARSSPPCASPRNCTGKPRAR